MLNFIKKGSHVLRILEETVLVISILVMVLIAFLQIIFRNISIPASWIDPALRYLVLWAGMIAASLATNYDKHIKIDLIGRFAKGKIRGWVNIITNFSSAIVCLILSLISLLYIVTIEYKKGAISNLFSIPGWILITIIPFSFCTMFIRFALRGMVSVKNLVNGIDEIHPHDNQS